jgi:hypothetical protein
LVLGVRPSVAVRIRQVDSRLAGDFAVEVVAWLRADVGVIDPAAFQVLTSATVLPAAMEAPKATAKK